MATGIYIDGLNLYYGALRGTTHKWLDLEKLAKTLLPDDEIKIIRYFTARITARPGDPQAPARQDTYIRALATTPVVQVHMGRFTTRIKPKILADHKFHPTEIFSPRFRPRSLYLMMWKDKVRRRVNDTTKAKVIIDEEKGSDVSLGVNLLNDSARGFIDKAVVISNDSDLSEAIRLSRKFDVPVGIVNPHKLSTHILLKKFSTFEIHLRDEVLSRCQFPITIRDSKGREIHKPKLWRETQRPALSDRPRAHLPKQVGR